MQIIKSFFKLVFFVLPVSVSAQSTYLNQGSKEYHFIDRLEIKQQKNSDLNFSTLNPSAESSLYSRRHFMIP